MPKVAVVMGSKSDNDTIKPAMETLEKLGIDYEVKVISAHRTPEKARQYGLTARDNGIEVIIAAHSQGDARLIEELADLAYHSLVLLAYKGLTPDDVRAELERRHRPRQHDDGTRTPGET